MQKPYDKTQQYCKYGHFDMTKKAAYTLTNGDELVAPWYYIYNNRKILLYVDQNGPVKMQYQPPNGILIFKRELGENQSKWQVWVQSPDLNAGIPVSNFNSPCLCYDLKKPKFTVNWTPEIATYTSVYDNVEIITEIFVPSDKATVCMKTTVKNTSAKTIDLSVTPSLFPYVNVPQMVAWDLPEWYLTSKPLRNGKAVTIHGQMSDPLMITENNRSVTFNFDFDSEAEFELDMSAFTGSGNFFSPNAVKAGTPMSYKMHEAEMTDAFSGYQAVYAARYKFSLDVGETKTFTQVMTVQESLKYDEQENRFEESYFDEAKFEKHLNETKAFYENLFTQRTIKTENPILDNFINNFTPLQMYWVCSLDRGWPSSMRGIRDASQDYTGMTHIMPALARNMLIEMLGHQQVDGWMPRQISTISREAPHDMRYYCDGGAFLLELVHEYLTFTRDTPLLWEKTYWLDSNEQSTIFEHIIRCMDFYLSEVNIGEHGLCKVWYGDWWDPMDKIGMDGRGETVTVTAQTVLNLKNLADMIEWLVERKEIEEKYLDLAQNYRKKRECFIKAMRTHAYNKAGYFNGYFNDNGKWLLSESDPDGESRVYLVSNAWAIISGCATEEMAKSICAVVEKESLGCVGYNTNSKYYAVCVDKAGRIGNGMQADDAGPYNHAQSFFVRACCSMGDAETAYKATRYILPIEEEYAPVEQTFAPPYAIANCYSNSYKSLHRVGFQFLSGTVSYVLRNFYSYFFGITYGYRGLTLKACLPKAFGDCEITFTYLNKKFTSKYRRVESEKKRVFFNGQQWKKTEYCVENGKEYPYFADEDMLSENLLEIEY